MTGPVRTRRPGLAAGMMVALCIPCVGFAWVSIRVYQLSRAPAESSVVTRPWTAALAPQADTLEDAAVTRLKAGLAALDQRQMPPSGQLQAYRRELEAAESLLERSVLASPVQAAALAKLAAVRWELEPQGPDSDGAEILGMIAAASSLAVQVPEVQAELGSLLLRMGRTEDAVPYFSRAVTLDPRVASSAVGTMYQGGLGRERIAASLPAVPEVLVALRRPYLAAGDVAGYIARLERSLSAAPDSVLRVYVDVCIENREAPRAFDAMQALDATDDVAMNAARLLHTSRAARAAGRGEVAVSLATRALEGFPESPAVLQELGLAYLSTGDSSQAVTALRAAVGAAAAANAPPRFRSALYRDLGRAEEAAGHPDRAYDEYRRSLRLDPDATFPRQRIEAMQRSAGTREP